MFKFAQILIVYIQISYIIFSRDSNYLKSDCIKLAEKKYLQNVDGSYLIKVKCLFISTDTFKLISIVMQC